MSLVGVCGSELVAVRNSESSADGYLYFLWYMKDGFKSKLPHLVMKQLHERDRFFNERYFLQQVCLYDYKYDN
jgi:hypothetical protein